MKNLQYTLNLKNTEKIEIFQEIGGSKKIFGLQKKFFLGQHVFSNIPTFSSFYFANKSNLSKSRFDRPALE